MDKKNTGFCAVCGAPLTNKAVEDGDGEIGGTAR